MFEYLSCYVCHINFVIFFLVAVWCALFSVCVCLHGGNERTHTRPVITVNVAVGYFSNKCVDTFFLSVIFLALALSVCILPVFD